MSTSQVGIDLIKKFEGGPHLVGYLCPAGVPTIGYGSTGPGISVGTRITKEEAELRLRKSLEEIEATLRNVIRVFLNQNESDALVSFAYNVGTGAFRRSTLLRLLNDGAPRTSVAAEFSRWNKIGSQPSAGLTERRKAEKELFLSPVKNPALASSIYALEDTWLKREPKQAGALAAEAKLFVPKGSAHQWQLIEIVPGQSHYRVRLKQQPDSPWWFWPAHFKIINDSEPVIATPPAPDNDGILKVPYYSQLDNKQQPYRTCFSSSCAMLLKYLRPNSISGDDQYIDTVFKYGDTTEATAQIAALKHYGVKAAFRTDGSWATANRLLASGMPVPMGILHKGPVTNPTGGHWIVAIGAWRNHQGYVVNDPYGELDLVSGKYINKNGASLRYSQKNLGPRWLVEGGASGWYIEALSW